MFSYTSSIARPPAAARLTLKKVMQLDELAQYRSSPTPLLSKMGWVPGASLALNGANI
jgi:hypothetical protein